MAAANPVVNRWLDLADRVGWTAVQAFFGFLVANVAIDGVVDWGQVLLGAGIAALIGVAKVIIGQNTGTDDTGSLIGQSVIQPPPVAETGTTLKK